MEEKFLQLSQAIQNGDVEIGVSQSLSLVGGGVDPLDIFTGCIQPTLADIGDKFGRMELFLPNLMLAGKVVKAIQEKLLPLLKEGQSSTVKKGKALIATVYGDLHDIGKNMVSIMLQVNGFEVKDLGVNVASAEIIKAAEDFNADVVCLSGLMIPSLPYMKDAIDQIKGNPKLSSRFKVLVGGGPVTEAWARNSGADGYADDAVGAVREAIAVLGR